MDLLVARPRLQLGPHPLHAVHEALVAPMPCSDDLIDVDIGSSMEFFRHSILHSSGFCFAFHDPQIGLIER